MTAGEAAKNALSHRGFWLLSLGFFVCGFHVVFIATHLPAYVEDHGLAASVGSNSLALIGLFNIFGTLAAGWLGSRFSKPRLLVAIYVSRAIAFAIYLSVPLTTGSTYVFASVMGILWLATVPLTNGVIASMFGVKNLAMLTGLAFLLHQIGSFLGGWLGGLIFEQTQSYDSIWILALALSLVAAVLNLFVVEKPIKTTQT